MVVKVIVKKKLCTNYRFLISCYVKRNNEQREKYVHR